MIPVRMYQDDRQLAWGKSTFPISSTIIAESGLNMIGLSQTASSCAIHSREWFRSTDLWVMGPARFLCATLLNEA